MIFSYVKSERGRPRTFEEIVMSNLMVNNIPKNLVFN